jgi:hypothetical protein
MSNVIRRGGRWNAMSFADLAGPTSERPNSSAISLALNNRHRRVPGGMKSFWARPAISITNEAKGAAIAVTVHLSRLHDIVTEHEAASSPWHAGYFFAPVAHRVTV